MRRRLSISIVPVTALQHYTSTESRQTTLTVTRQIRDRQNVAHALKEPGLLVQQGQLEQTLCVLLSAEVGLAMVRFPDAYAVDERLRQVGETAFLSTARHAAEETPEPAYGLERRAA
jgi:hypothetical protein